MLTECYLFNVFLRCDTSFRPGKGGKKKKKKKITNNENVPPQSALEKKLQVTVEFYFIFLSIRK